MSITYRITNTNEAEEMVEIYNLAFYDDYVRYGACPGYGLRVEDMRHSIEEKLKYTILDGERSIGAISVTKQDDEDYHLDCLCIIPEYQGKGIGTAAIRFLENELKDWKSFSLETPLTKTQNVKFYTEKCGFEIIDTIKDGDVELYIFKKNGINS